MVKIDILGQKDDELVFRTASGGIFYLVSFENGIAQIRYDKDTKLGEFLGSVEEFFFFFFC